MSRLEKKCLMASASMHALLVFLLAVAPFLGTSRHPPVVLTSINFIPSRLIDGATSGGGSPTAKEPPKLAPVLPMPAPVQPAPQPVKQVEPEPTPVEPDPEPPVRPRKNTDSAADKKPAKANDTAEAPDGKAARRKVQISLTREPSGTGRKAAAESRARAEAAAKAAQAQYAARVQSVLGAIGQGLPSGTSIEVPGPGGEAYADYSQWLVAVYHRAWAPPTSLAEGVPIVEATVVVLRNGTVESFKVTRRSGNAALDKSVERLKQVTTIAPFPAGAPDERRTFIIEFDLKAKQSIP
ncbi:MAG: TonB C-terminal domain-containing protein [Verrucomicrobiota bacterium]